MTTALAADEPARRRCPRCWDRELTVAHVVLEAVAVMLAQPLRDAFDRHCDEHLCATGDIRSPHYRGGSPAARGSVVTGMTLAAGADGRMARS